MGRLLLLLLLIYLLLLPSRRSRRALPACDTMATSAWAQSELGAQRRGPAHGVPCTAGAVGMAQWAWRSANYYAVGQWANTH